MGVFSIKVPSEVLSEKHSSFPLLLLLVCFSARETKKSPVQSITEEKTTFSASNYQNWKRPSALLVITALVKHKRAFVLFSSLQFCVSRFSPTPPNSWTAGVWKRCIRAHYFFSQYLFSILSKLFYRSFLMALALLNAVMSFLSFLHIVMIVCTTLFFLLCFFPPEISCQTILYRIFTFEAGIISQCLQKANQFSHTAVFFSCI